jgi:hypothetical protein
MADKTLREMIYKSFATMPKKEQKQAKADGIVPPVRPPAPIKVDSPRSVGDVTIAMQAQSIYSPNLPGAPPSAPNAKQMDTGTVSEMEPKSKWDKGNA